jgi:hypothetical protein
MKQFEPTEDEKKNGWTKKSLNAYLKKRHSSQYRSVYDEERQATPPTRQNNNYNPHRWRDQ